MPLHSWNLPFYLRMASSSSRVKKPPNVLVCAPNCDMIRKSVRSALAIDKYVFYGISTADLISAPWQDNAVTLIVSTELCTGDNMVQIMDFATDHGAR